MSTYLKIMANDFNWRRHCARLLATLWKVAVGALAVIGFLWLVGGPLLRLLLSPLYVTEVVRREYPPDGSAIADVEVRRGGFGTVWTTRVHLAPKGQPRWTVYESHDSDFVPPLQWLNSRTLLIGLPCGRFDHLSNPDDWESSTPRPNRLRVRFARLDSCP